MVKEELVGQIELSKEQFAIWQKIISNISQFSKNLNDNVANIEQITATLQMILAGTVILNGSDIHFEPGEQKIKLRIRLDGIMHDASFIESPLYNKLLSRIKLLSGLKLNVTNQSQDGRFTLQIAGNDNKTTEIEVRVSVLPSEYGEAVVMRVLNPQSLLCLEELGIRQDLREAFDKEINRPNGMFIVTGPTGSGKTTTLYAVLKKIRNPEIKIITIEDPVEYHLEGISQSQVNPESGYTFASGLQAIVRQDPDTILVGEIRDLETAQMAIQAALTGHLVLTTLHTNDAAGTVARLQALGEKPSEIASALNAVVAQRLVRKVCEACSKMEKPNEQEFEEIKKEIMSLPAEIKKALKTETLMNGLKIPQAKGCEQCNSTGYKSRIGIYEMLIIDEELENFISKIPSIVDLNKKAREKGMVTIKQDGIIKVLQGATTLDEVNRMVGE